MGCMGMVHWRVRSVFVPLPITFLQVDLGAAKRELEDERNRGDARMRELEDKIRDKII